MNRALTSQRREIQTVRDQLAKAEAVKERVKTLEREIAERDKKLARTVADLTERDRLLADNAAALKSLQSYRSLYDEMKANMDRTMREAPPKPRGDTPAPSTSYAAAPPAAAAVDPQRAARPAVGTAVLERSALKLSAALAMRPHINKVAKGGEDAALVLDRHLIVADGVGSWGDEGVDPSLYSRSLVQNVAKGLQKGRSVILAMDEAHKQTKAAGSATLCVAAFDEKRGRLTVASLGDSQVKIVRGGRVVFASGEINRERGIDVLSSYLLFFLHVCSFASLIASTAHISAPSDPQRSASTHSTSPSRWQARAPTPRPTRPPTPRCRRWSWRRGTWS